MAGVSKPVRIIETGQIFASQSACARAIGGYPGGVERCINGRRRTYRGYTFESVELNSYYITDLPEDLMSTLLLAKELVVRDITTGGSVKRTHVERLDNLIAECGRKITDGH